MDERTAQHPCPTCAVARCGEAVTGVLFQIRIDGLLLEHSAHPLKNAGMDLAVVSGPLYRHLTRNGLDVYQLSRIVELLDLPHTSRERKAISDRRRGGNGSYLIRAAADGIVLTVLEHCIELKARGKALTAQTDNKLALLGHLEPIAFYHRDKQLLIIITADRGKRRQRQHSLGKGARSKRACGGEHRQRLLKEQTHRQLFKRRRLDKALLDIELDYRYRAYQLPRNKLRQRCIRQRHILAKYHHHLGNAAASAGASYPLQQTRYRDGRAHLQHPLKPANIYAELHRDRRAGDNILIVILHPQLRLLAQLSGEIAVMNEKTVRLSAIVGYLTQRRGNILGLLA